MGRGRAPCAYSEAEARSLRLGLLLMGSGLVGLLLLGFCWLSPALRELQGRPANCTVLAVRLRPELFECTFSCGAACRGVSTYPCLQVFVNASQLAAPDAPQAPQAPRLLHQDEQQLLANPKCSYIPPCERENQKNSEIVTHWQDYWEEEVGLQPFTCYFNPHLRPDDVLLRRTHDESVILHCFLWPMVTFLVGVLIVLLTICAKTLAVKAEAMKKRKHT